MLTNAQPIVNLLIEYEGETNNPKPEDLAFLSIVSGEEDCARLPRYFIFVFRPLLVFYMMYYINYLHITNHNMSMINVQYS